MKLDQNNNIFLLIYTNLMLQYILIPFFFLNIPFLEKNATYTSS